MISNGSSLIFCICRVSTQALEDGLFFTSPLSERAGADLLLREPKIQQIFSYFVFWGRSSLLAFQPCVKIIQFSLNDSWYYLENSLKPLRLYYILRAESPVEDLTAAKAILPGTRNRVRKAELCSLRIQNWNPKVFKCNRII